MIHGKDVIKNFIENSFKGIDQVFQMELGFNLETKQEKFYQKQTTSSGGFLAFFLMQEVQESKKKYYDKPGRGSGLGTLQKLCHLGRIVSLFLPCLKAREFRFVPSY